MTNALYIRLGRSRLTVVTVSNRFAGHCQKEDQQRNRAAPFNSAELKS